MQRTLILYESKYGSTENIAKNIALILGPAKYCRIDEFKESYKEFECFVVGTPIYEGKIEGKILDFIISNSSWLSSKRLAFFFTCLTIKKQEIYIKQITQILGDNIMHFRALGGKLELNKLTHTDYNSITSFYKNIKAPLIDINMHNLQSVVDFALDIKKIKENFVRKMPELLLLKTIEEFLISHNTCTLCTSYGRNVRSTPMEYIYNNEYIYFITEGGEKFANILLNNMVSIAIYENYESMMKLAGMQITGMASIVDDNSEEYNNILAIQGIKPEQIKALTVMMNIIRVKINKIEFLYSKFKNMGYDPKQIYILR